jgi:hypothetical protein
MAQSLKQDVLDAISKLPDSASIDDIMYRLYVIDKIKKGQKAMETCNTVTVDDLKKEIESW